MTKMRTIIRTLTLNPVLTWVGFFVWVGIIFYLSSLTPSGLPDFPTIWNFDKLLHSSAFCGGAIVLSVALRNWPQWSWKKIILIVIFSLMIYGILDEWHQLYTPGRNGGSVGDVIADTLGATLGALLTPKLYGYLVKPL